MSPSSPPAPADPRALITAELVTRAQRDPAFRDALVTNPRATIAQTLGLSLPQALEITVHVETPHALHLVLPLAAEAFAAVAREVDLGDREVAAYADKDQGDEYTPPIQGQRWGYPGPIEH